MKLYNPFRQHCCQFGDGSFGVRKFSLAWLSWMYLDTRDMEFWQSSAFPGSRHASLEDAKAAAERFKAEEDGFKRHKDRNKSRRVS